MSFKRTIEDFECSHCHTLVRGDGYTNHCPRCLWGKHVDINPGDRAAECKGMMKPIGIALKNGENIIAHRCVTCGFERNNKIQSDDDQTKILELASPRQ